MRSVLLSLFAAFVLFQGSAIAQVGINNITISTTPDGNISWNANVDGHNRKGYYDKHMSTNICNTKKVDKDVLIPVTSNLYPNPSTDMLFFTGTGYDYFTVIIKDASGQVMATEKYFDSTSMDISAFADGNYTIEIAAEKTGQVVTKKFTK